jgi:hypothetical protein
MTDRIVQTTWTDGGRHQPLPPPDDDQGDEIERLMARIAELEAKGRATRAAIGRLDVLACTDSEAIWWEFGGVRFDRAIDAVDAVISAIETPDPRP